MTVATRKVTGRRKLRFASLEDLSAELDQLAAAPLRQLGNWSLGQICRHLAVAMNGSIDGYGFQAPWAIRLVAPLLLKNRMLNKGMAPGFKLPAYAANTMAPAAVDDATGVSELRAAIARQQRESHREPSPFFGRMTNEEWTKLHLRHAEMHLSFVEPL